MRQGHRAVVLLFCASLGCVHWRSVNLADIHHNRVDLRLHEVRVEADNSTVDLTVHRVAWPYLDGWNASLHREQRVDLERSPRVSLRAPDHLLSAILVGAAYAVIATLSFLALASSSPSIFGQ